MNASIEKLLALWRFMDLKIPFGNSPAEISDFETRRHLVLPDDFREYFRAVDAFGMNTCAKQGKGEGPFPKISLRSFAQSKSYLP